MIDVKSSTNPFFHKKYVLTYMFTIYIDSTKLNISSYFTSVVVNGKIKRILLENKNTPTSDTIYMYIRCYISR